MKRLLSLLLLFVIMFTMAQDIYLRKIHDIHTDKSDTSFFALAKPFEGSKLLAEMEVIGDTESIQELFFKIRYKAKEIGANSYTINYYQNIDGTQQEFDLSHFKLNLYFSSIKNIVNDMVSVYVFSSSNKIKNISINNTKITLLPNSFIKLIPAFGQRVKISTRKLLGSTISYSNTKGSGTVYFQVLGFSFRENSDYSGSLNIKTGDIIRLDPYFGQFLTLIYQEQPFNIENL